MPPVILVCTGQFADGKGSPCYQLHRLQENGTYVCSQEDGPNDPVHLVQAQARLFNAQSKADDFLMEKAKNLLAEIEQAIEDDDADDLIEALDELVHDAYSRQASSTNSDGYTEQVLFLLRSGYSIEELCDALAPMRTP